jgi:hypothetical protein
MNIEEFNKEVEERTPGWIDEGLEYYDIESIQQGGCASGAYMPAVTYHQAIETMSEHGNQVLEYIEEQLGEIPQPKKGESWSGIAVFYLSYAVELWASSFDLDEVDTDE